MASCLLADGSPACSSKEPLPLMEISVQPRPACRCPCERGGWEALESGRYASACECRMRRAHAIR